MKEERQEQIKAAAESLLEEVDEHFKNYYAPADQQLLATMLSEYYQHVPMNMQPSLIYQKFNEYKGEFDKYAENVFEESVFADKARVVNFLNDPDLKTLEKDPALELANAFMGKLMEASGEFQMAQAALTDAERLFMAGLRELQSDKVFLSGCQLHYAHDLGGHGAGLRTC